MCQNLVCLYGRDPTWHKRILTHLYLQSQSLRYFQHPLDRTDSFFLYFFVDKDFREFVFQTIIQFLHRVQAHEITFIAGTCAVIRRSRDKFLIRTLFTHLVDNAAFRRHNEPFIFRLDSMLQKSRSRSNEVRDLYNGLLALRMSNNFRIGVLFFNSNIFSSENCSCTWQAPSQSNILRPVMPLI